MIRCNVAHKSNTHVTFQAPNQQPAPSALPGEPGDAALIEACLQGDQEAWRLLVERYAPLVYQVPLRRGLPLDQAADIFQDVFVLLVNKLPEIKQPDRVRAWLVTTARRETARHLRGKPQQAQVPLSDEDQGAPVVLDDELDDLLIRPEERRLVRQALSMLDQRCAALLTMLFASNPAPSYAEIAAALNLREGSIGPSRARCLERCRQVLESLGF